MASLDRRAFLESVAAAGVGAFSAVRTLQAADALVTVDPSSQLGPIIAPHLYGHFIEHLGGVIYDGIWVGRDSTIPNVGGIRKQFIDDMRRIGAPNLRWPGGCFADGYHWRDGIGAVEAAEDVQLLGTSHARRDCTRRNPTSSAFTSSWRCAAS